MAEYIDRRAAIALAKDIIVPTKSGYDYRHRCIDPQDLVELPAADVSERKAGKWIHDELGENKMPVVKCSECGLIEPWFEVEGMGFALHGQKYANFCPNCGAKMEG